MPHDGLCRNPVGKATERKRTRESGSLAWSGCRALVRTLFAAGSVVSALGTGLEVVVLGRVLQGAGSAIGVGLPTDGGYTEAFLVGSGVALLAALTAALIPSRSGRMAHAKPATQAA